MNDFIKNYITKNDTTLIEIRVANENDLLFFVENFPLANAYAFEHDEWQDNALFVNQVLYEKS